MQRSGTIAARCTRAVLGRQSGVAPLDESPSDSAAPAGKHVLEIRSFLVRYEYEEAVARLHDRASAWRDSLAVTRDDSNQSVAW
jgi:hypothetical protein